ncbi:MAG: phosphoribosylformylglycinamidine synthase subunit PurL [Chloroflexota bacterium]|nr:MAG: phosphoribosylformylglycinamidine synthase subunit PurL [Chloroflexota bacterium]
MPTKVDKKILDEIALSPDEYDLIERRLGREPTPVELGIFGAMWSEHCGYKHSKPLLRLFPTTGERVLISLGEENAGVVDIGDGQAVVMKIESHNHPSAIEPFQGAATGVGGIIRDIFTMGARPIALLNSLRFGPLDDSRNRFLFNGVVAGIAAYGNCMGLPTVAGEVYFDPTYTQNPLVNAMCVGLAQAGSLIRARAAGAGNSLLLVGADTGRDGIHGATFASVELDDASEERRPAVQVGNPFMEKLLMEACLELLHTDYVVGMQDLGAAGLTSSIVECADKGGSGVEIDVLKVSRRERGMTPYEIMLSESQERMLVIVKQGYEDKVKAVFDRWDLHSDVIGHVTDDGMVRVREGDKVVANLPAELLTSPPTYTREVIKPAWLSKLQTFSFRRLPDIQAEPKHGAKESWGLSQSDSIKSERSANQILLRLLASPTIASKEYVYRQYDHQVLTNTVVAPGADAAVLRIKGTRKAIALTTDCNGRFCYLEPQAGGAIAVAEAARNLVCVGAKPLAVTDCLNFGNPEKPDIYYQLDQVVRGMAEACRTLDTPVISGNVSLYNETNGEAVHPTPVVGMVGLIDDLDRICRPAFQQEGDFVLMLGGAPSRGADDAALAGSEYASLVHDKLAGRPQIDLDLESRLQSCCLQAIHQRLIKSAHDCAEGGLAVALAESCIAGHIGFKDWSLAWDGRNDAALFGEAQSRIIVSLAPGMVSKMIDLARAARVPVTKLGTVGGDRLVIEGHIDLSVRELEQVWRSALESAVQAS